MEYFSSLKPKLIYVFRIPDGTHADCLKIGEATFEDGDITQQPNSKSLNKAARARIDQYTKTAGIAYELLHTEIAITVRGGAVLGFIISTHPIVSPMLLLKEVYVISLLTPFMKDYASSSLIHRMEYLQ